MDLPQAVAIADAGPEHCTEEEWAEAERVLISPPLNGDNAPESPVGQEDGVPE